MNYRVREGKGTEFEDGFRGVLEVMGTIDGHTESHLYRDTDDDKEYLIVSEWSSQEDFQAFIRSEQFAAATAWGSAEILEGRPKHKVYQH
jgi:heme-degrading monooxygenase HmoA